MVPHSPSPAERNLQKVQAECKTLCEEESHIITADLTNEAETKDMFEKFIARFKHLDVLVNNAGIFELGILQNTCLEQYERVFNTNVRSMYQLTMLATPHLIARKGSIVNVSSVAGLRAYVGCLAYNMSKAAVDHFTRCVALELAPKGVRVNSVNPGSVPTEIQRRGGIVDDAWEKYVENSIKAQPLGRLGTVEEVAKAVLFLASEYASFSTGVTLPVDGGRHAVGSAGIPN